MIRHDHAVQAGQVIAAEDRELVGVFRRRKLGAQKLRVSPFSAMPCQAWSDYQWVLTAIVTPSGQATVLDT